MTARTLAIACVLLAYTFAVSPQGRAMGNEVGRIASALEKIAGELPRMRQAMEKQAQSCTQQR